MLPPRNWPWQIAAIAAVRRVCIRPVRLVAMLALAVVDALSLDRVAKAQSGPRLYQSPEE